MPPSSDLLRTYIALGSNVTSELGDPVSHIAAAIDRLSRLPRSTLIARSSLVRTAPVGPQDQPHYLNAVVALDTSLAARELLNHLLDIERSRGRDRSREQRWGPRTLDLDLLLYGDRITREPGLVVPHPRMHERTFVLDPLAELAPDLIIPGLNLTVRALAERAHRAPYHPP